MADYLMDAYVWPFLPFEVDEQTKKDVSDRFVTFIGHMDWLCKYQDPMKIFDNHTSFLFGELLFIILCIITFVHAYRNGGRYLYVWIAITIHALNVENLCYWIPDMDNFWQAQGILTFFGARAPLYILFGIYHMFDYSAYVMVQKMHLPWWAEGPAVGLCAVMLDLPYDILGIKNLWWTWHDTDPNIFDRMYWVPWNSYYFHASFACSLVWILNASRYYLVDAEYDWRKFGREFLCSFIAGTLAFWLGTIQFALLYHPLHDIFGVHSEITTILFLSLYAVIVISADRNNIRNNGVARKSDSFWFDEIPFAICLEYLFFMVLVCVCDPLNVVSDGLHQPIGPCNETQKVQTPTGMVLTKKKYLCPTKYDEKYFDFHCLPNGGVPKQIDENPLEWYAVCGTEFENRTEYIAIIWGSCCLFLMIFYQMAARSGPLPHAPAKRLRLRQTPSRVNTPRKAVKQAEAEEADRNTFRPLNPQPLPQSNQSSINTPSNKRTFSSNDHSHDDDYENTVAEDTVSPTITKAALRSSKTPKKSSERTGDEWTTVSTVKRRTVTKKK